MEMEVRKILHWLANGETGISSKTMAFCALGIKYKGQCHPLDPSDFNRCLKLVAAAPEVENYFGEIAKISKKWAVVIENWHILKAMFEAEVGKDWSKGGRAEATYLKMKELGL